MHHEARTADEFYTDAYEFGEDVGKFISAIYDLWNISININILIQMWKNLTPCASVVSE